MARKYDRYGLNRQFKRKPLTKRTPFPHKLPFVDDFSYGAVIHRVKSEKQDQDWDFYEQKRKRPVHEQYQLPAPKYGKYKADWKGTAKEIAKDGGFAIATVAGGAAVEFVLAGGAVEGAAAEAKLVRPRLTGKVPGLVKGGIKNVRTLYRLAKSQRRKYKIARFVIRHGKKYL